jgi:hypothetical protein
MFRLLPSLTCAILLAAVSLLVPQSHAQKHSLGSAPPTPPAAAAPVVRQPPPASSTHSGGVAPASSGLGALQFLPASANVPAPQTLTRQLSAEDERTRSGALASLGAPSQYFKGGHSPVPHSMELDMVQLGNTDDLDALLTVELDEHIVSAVLVPEGEGWRRVATLLFASSFSSGMTTPASFVRPLRSWLEPGRYRAVYHAMVAGQNQDFTENEADLRIINGRAVIVMSFVSGARQCEPSASTASPSANSTTTAPAHVPRPGCEILQRWLEPDPTDPTRHFTLITGTGHFSAHEADDPLSHSRNYRLTRLRSFSCQPFAFAEGSQHFEPTANSSPCAAREAPAPVHTDRPDHPSAADHP